MAEHHFMGCGQAPLFAEFFVRGAHAAPLARATEAAGAFGQGIARTGGFQIGHQ
jgi:hypothetical protein